MVEVEIFISEVFWFFGRCDEGFERVYVVQVLIVD